MASAHHCMLLHAGPMQQVPNGQGAPGIVPVNVPPQQLLSLLQSQHQSHSGQQFVLLPMGQSAAMVTPAAGLSEWLAKVVHVASSACAPS